ncbi:hypothetical protein CspeluHIS016_0211970 [Cutaneotrichosporon spelunceum]|uniref:Cyclophilin-like domain-containing protein n=1 Tax=Cutaneotrichosporon spelunceum TaxID=1672016 RepID=A0AAD3TSI3_9TREE|nr:hypothetical protein CspeluHIS016_0211970 [Cutaneotrichosporon spelunceum]
MAKHDDLILITAGGFRFIGALETANAPKTVAFFRSLLPYKQKLIHTGWADSLPNENHTAHPAPGQLGLYPGGISETEFLFAYGGVAFASKMGMLTANHFLTVVAGMENLRKLGEKVLWEGAQEVVFDYATDEDIASIKVVSRL